METALKNVSAEFTPDKTYTLEEYLLIEDRSIEKHEFFNGEVIKMPGAKPEHNLIAANIITELKMHCGKRRKNTS